jgi:hypothetical protein
MSRFATCSKRNLGKVLAADAGTSVSACCVRRERLQVVRWPLAARAGDVNGRAPREPSGLSLKAGPRRLVALWLWSPRSRSALGRRARRAECNHGCAQGIAVLASRAPGTAGVRCALFGRFAREEPGLLGTRALWPSGPPRLEVARRGEVTSGHAICSPATTASRSRFHVDRHSVGVE